MTGTDYIDIKEAARLLGKTQRYISWLCGKGRLPGAIKAGGRWKIPLTADPQLAKASAPENLTDPGELQNLPVKKRDEAIRRLGIIRDFERFTASLGRSRTEALQLYVAGHNDIAKRTLERWLSRYRDEGLAGLVDRRAGGRLDCETISPEAFELFKSIFLTQQRMSVKTCWQNISYVNRSENRGWRIPPLAVMYRYVKDAIPLYVQVLHREGLAAYEARCAPYIETDPDSIQPGQVWVGDHSQFNCWVRYRGRWIRPWITAWQDMRSRMIVGWHISAGPNQTTILLAFKRAIEKYGPPDSVKIDNGRDYDSECWTGTTKVRRRVLNAGYIDEQMVAGIYAMLDIAVSFAKKYHPQSKPLERFFDTIDCQLIKTIPTYCGKDTERKPDYIKDLLNNEKAIRQAYNLEEFAETVGRYVEQVYNKSAHTGRGMEARTPVEVFAKRTSRRVLVDGVTDLLMRVWSGELTIGKNGVKFKEMWYGQYDLELLSRQGGKVRVSYDPADLRRVYVYDAATLKLMTIAEQNQLVRYGAEVAEESLREAMHQQARIRRIGRAYRDTRLTANMDLTTLTIRAMQEGTKETAQEPKQRTIRPVRTPLDSQVREHKRRQAVKAVKKAAGAETVSEVIDLDLSVLGSKHNESEAMDFDLSLLKSQTEHVDLWDG